MVLVHWHGNFRTEPPRSVSSSASRTWWRTGYRWGPATILGLKSDLQQNRASVAVEKPWRRETATALAFAAVGAVPLLAYGVAIPPGASIYHRAVVFASIALVFAGRLRTRIVASPIWKGTAEMLAIVLGASGAAYAIGAAVEALTR